MVEKFWLAFLPLFIAVDAVGLLPLFMGLTVNLDRRRVRRVIVQSVITAAAVSLVFLAVGSAVLEIVGVTIADFMIAGGFLLFVLSLSGLLSMETRAQRIDPESMGAVPLGVPLMVGPAVLTSILILVPAHGAFTTVAALLTNILIAGAVFWFAEPIIRLLGNSGAVAVSKIGDLLLAAIAVMLIRKGLVMAMILK